METKSSQVNLKKFVFNFHKISIAFTFVVMFFLSHYFELSIGKVTSFYASDTWCYGNINFAGDHCFGDFGKAMILVSEQSNVWDNDLLSTPYPAANYIFYKGLLYLSDIFSSNFIYLVNIFIIILSVVLPALLYFYRFRNNSINGVDSLLLAFCNLPLLIAIDRGSSAVFPLIFIYLFITNLGKFEVNKSLFWLSLAVAFRPQLILFALIYLFFGKYTFLRSSLLSVGSFILSFIIYSGINFFEYLKSWFSQIMLYNDVESNILNEWPPNYNPGVGFVRIWQLFSKDPWVDPRLVSNVILLLFFSSLIILLKSKFDIKVNILFIYLAFVYLSVGIAFMPIYAYGYYACYLILPLFIAIYQIGDSKTLGLGSPLLGYLLIFNLCLSISPLVIPVLSENLNLIQYLIPVFWMIFMLFVAFYGWLNFIYSLIKNYES